MAINPSVITPSMPGPSLDDSSWDTPPTGTTAVLATVAFFAIVAFLAIVDLEPTLLPVDLNEMVFFAPGAAPGFGAVTSVAAAEADGLGAVPGLGRPGFGAVSVASGLGAAVVAPGLGAAAVVAPGLDAGGLAVPWPRAWVVVPLFWQQLELLVLVAPLLRWKE